MGKKQDFTTIIVITSKDFPRLVRHYKRLVANIPSERIVFVSDGSIESELIAADLGEGVSFVDESILLTFQAVADCMTEHLKPLLGSEPVPRGAVGWYYQQFLKMEYSRICKDEYYMVWDGDTIPTAPFSMFQQESSKPYLDMKQEYHALYFETIEKILPGMRKVIGRSFISEHMLFNSTIMKEMIERIESNDLLPGRHYWEKIIHAISPSNISESGFSEFETYGTFVAFMHPDHYKLREWHSFRLGAEFFDLDTISDRDFEWLSKDFYAISFEKNQFVREDNKNLFDNPRYQEKLSARKMLEVAQEEFKGGYIEVWGDTHGIVGTDPLTTGVKNDKPRLSECEFLARLGDMRLEAGNSDQAYLCYEQAAFLCTDEKNKKLYNEKCETAKKKQNFTLRPVSVCIVSYNNRKLMEECIRSIKYTCNPEYVHIVVTDNASTDNVRDYLRSISDDITLIESDKNLGFPAGCNVCIKHSNPDSDIFLLNNDTRMTHNALFWLRYGLYSDCEIGAAGCIGTYAGNEQMVSIGSDDPSDVLNFAHRINVYSDNPYEEKSRLCGFAMMIKRPVLDNVGLLDESFTPGYYEDDDLSLRINSAGYRMIVVHNSFIYHRGSASFNANIDRILLTNYEYSKKKNGYDNLMAAVIFDSEKKALRTIMEDKKESFSLLEINCGSGNFLSYLKYAFPQSSLRGTSAVPLEVEHSVHCVPIIVYDPAGELPDMGADLFDYVLVRILDYGEGEENSPGYISSEEAKKRFAYLVKEGGKLLYLTT